MEDIIQFKDKKEKETLCRQGLCRYFNSLRENF